MSNQYTAFLYTARDVLGDALAGVTIAVLSGTLPEYGGSVNVTTEPGSPLANIYWDPAGTDPMENPTTTDGMGNLLFFAPSGYYVLQTYGPTVNPGAVQVSLATSGPAGPTGPTGPGGAAQVLLNLENGVPDMTGNSFYSVVGLTNWECAHWEFVPGVTSSVYFSMRLQPTLPNTASVILELFSNNTTGTMYFNTADYVVNSGSVNVGTLNSGTQQTYTSTSPAYERVTLTFPVNSVLVANGLLVIKVTASATGTNPSNNVMMLAYLGLT
jgi:hypothetical protein